MSAGEATAEWRVLDEAAGLVDLSFRRSILASGEERVRFLQGQLSNDIATLEAGAGVAALALSAQGRVQEMLDVFVREESLELVVDGDRLESTRARLERFLVADDVEFSVEPPCDRVGIAGPAAREILARAGLACDPTPGKWSIQDGEIAGVPVRALSCGQWRIPWVELVAPSGGVAVRQRLEALGARATGADAAEIVRIESGVARLGIDVDEERLATEGRLEWSIHFAKGCYVGQEVIERSVSRGRLNRELCLLGADAQLAPGDRIEGAAEKDVVTSVADSPRAGHLALAYVPLERATEGTELSALGGRGPVRCRVLPWPRPRHLAGR